MALTFDTEFLKSRLLEDLNESMAKAAEPVIQQALKDIEIEMRMKLASNLIAMIDQNIIFEVDQHQVSIRIRRD